MARISQEAIALTAAAIQDGDLLAAYGIRNREFGQNPNEIDAHDIRTMQLILNRTPAVLSDRPNEVLSPMRVAAALMHLWRESSLHHFITVEGELDYWFTLGDIAGMLHSHACWLMTLERFRSLPVKRAKFIASGNSNDCEACKAAHGATFPIDAAPELPLAECRCRTGCGCRVVMVAVED